MSGGKVLKFPCKPLRKAEIETTKENFDAYEKWERSQFWGGVLTFSAAVPVMGLLLYLLKLISKG